MKAKIWHKAWWVNDCRTKALDSTISDILERSGFHICDTLEYEFQPYGFTKLWLLSESHFALHSFPEEGKTYLELSSCNEAYFNACVTAIEAAYGGK